MAKQQNNIDINDVFESLLHVAILETPSKYLSKNDKKKAEGSHPILGSSSYIYLLMLYFAFNKEKLSPEHKAKINTVIKNLISFNQILNNIQDSYVPTRYMINKLLAQLDNPEGIFFPVTIKKHMAIGRIKRVNGKYMYIEHNSGFGTSIDGINQSDSSSKSHGTSAFYLREDITSDEVKSFIEESLKIKYKSYEIIEVQSSKSEYILLYRFEELKKSIIENDKDKKFDFTRIHKEQDRGNCVTVSLRRYMQHELGNLSITLKDGTEALLADDINYFIRSCANKGNLKKILDSVKIEEEFSEFNDFFLIFDKELTKEKAIIQKSIQESSVEKDTYKRKTFIYGFGAVMTIGLALGFLLVQIPILPLMIAISLSGLLCVCSGILMTISKNNYDIYSSANSFSEYFLSRSSIIPIHIVKPLEEEIGLDPHLKPRLEKRLAKRESEGPSF